MLFIFRRVGQSVFLVDPLRPGHDTKVMIFSATKNGEIKIGFDAHPDVKIITEENLLIAQDDEDKDGNTND